MFLTHLLGMCTFHKCYKIAQKNSSLILIPHQTAAEKLEKAHFQNVSSSRINVIMIKDISGTFGVVSMSDWQQQTTESPDIFNWSFVQIGY